MTTTHESPRAPAPAGGAQATTGATTDRRKLLGRALCATALAGLVLLSVDLAVHRIYQVDEAQNVFSARLAALGKSGEFYTNGSLVLVGPLTWIARTARTSVAMFTGSRLLFTALFWTNLALVPIAMGFRPRRSGYWWALLGTATIAPLWDYGFEIRHDNLMLTLLLLFWIALRAGADHPRTAFAVMGALAATLQAVAFKSFLYWVPITLAALAFPPMREGRWRRTRLGAVWLSAFAFSALVLAGVYLGTGLWGSFREGLLLALSVSGRPERVSPSGTLQRLLLQAPLLVALTLAALGVVWTDWRRRGTEAVDRDSAVPELLLFLLALGALLANPAPYPYNLVLLVPFMVLPLRSAGIRLRALAPRLCSSTPLAALLVTCHLTPFIRPVLRHLEWTNDRQQELMGLAESLTDADRDRVYDGIGLVPTRSSIGRFWFLHSLFMADLRSGTLPSPASMLAARPASVLLRSYRTDWFSPEDVAFVSTHYVELSDELLVLGGVLPPGGGSWECLHEGTYALLLQDDAPPGAGLEVFLDGKACSFGTRLRIEKGVHHLASTSPGRILVLWTGPRTSLPVLKPGDHRRLFVNWY